MPIYSKENIQINNQTNSDRIDVDNTSFSLTDSQEDRISKLNAEYEQWDKTREVTFDERDALRTELNTIIRGEE